MYVYKQVYTYTYTYMYIYICTCIYTHVLHMDPYTLHPALCSDTCNICMYINVYMYIYIWSGYGQ